MSENPQQAKNRLFDIDTEEVSLVDVPAIKRKFLLVKRMESGMAQHEINLGEDGRSGTAVLDEDVKKSKADRLNALLAKLSEKVESVEKSEDLDALFSAVEKALGLDKSKDEEEEETEKSEDETDKADEDAPPPPPAEGEEEEEENEPEPEEKTAGRISEAMNKVLEMANAAKQEVDKVGEGEVPEAVIQMIGAMRDEVGMLSADYPAPTAKRDGEFVDALKNKDMGDALGRISSFAKSARKLTAEKMTDEGKLAVGSVCKMVTDLKGIVPEKSDDPIMARLDQMFSALNKRLDDQSADNAAVRAEIEKIKKSAPGSSALGVETSQEPSGESANPFSGGAFDDWGADPHGDRGTKEG